MTIRLIKLLLLAAIPTVWFSSPAIASDWIYQAKQNDTLWDLCLEYTNKRGCWIELQKYNNIPNDKRIAPGTEIRIPASWLRSPRVVGTVLGVQGEVSYSRFSATKGAPLGVGEPVHLGGVIRTGDGSVRIALAQDSELLLSADSVLELTTFGIPGQEGNFSKVNLKQGSVDAAVVPNRGTQFQIETSAAIAAVRGTQYRVVSVGGETESMRAEVLSGAVAVGTQTPTLVAAGFGVITNKGAAPGTPKALLPAPSLTLTHMNMPAPAVLEWAENGDEASWQLDLLAPGEGAAVIQTVRTAQPHVQLNQLTAQCYTVVLRAIDTEGFHGLETRSPLCVAPTLAAVSGVSAVSDDDSWIVRWPAVEGAQRYRVELAVDASFNTIIDSTEVVGLEARLPTPASRSFSTRITALDQHGNASPVSEPLDHTQDVFWEGWAFTALFLLLAL